MSVFTKRTQYPVLTSELWGTYCKELGENWPHYNDITLYKTYNYFNNDMLRVPLATLYC